MGSVPQFRTRRNRTGAELRAKVRWGPYEIANSNKESEGRGEREGGPPPSLGFRVLRNIHYKTLNPARGAAGGFKPPTAEPISQTRPDRPSPIVDTHPSPIVDTHQPRLQTPGTVIDVELWTPTNQPNRGHPSTQTSSCGRVVDTHQPRRTRVVDTHQPNRGRELWTPTNRIANQIVDTHQPRLQTPETVTDASLQLRPARRAPPRVTPPPGTPRRAPASP